MQINNKNSIMGYFLLSQVCCLLIVTAESYVLFAANLDDFKNLAKRFVPENLAGKLTKIVSESSVQFKKEKEEAGDHFSDDVRTPQRDKNIVRHGIKRPGAYGVDRKTQKNDFSSTRFKIENHDKSSDEIFHTTPSIPIFIQSRFNTNKPVNDDRSKEEKGTDREVEEENDRIQFTTTKASKDRRYKTVQRTTPTKQWFEQSSAYLPKTMHHLPSFIVTSPKNIFDVDVRKEATLTSTGNDIEITDSDDDKTHRDNVRYVTTLTKDVSTKNREVDEKKTRPKKINTPAQEEFDYENAKIKVEKQLRINGRNVQKQQVNKQIESDGEMMFDKVVLNKNKGSYEELPEKDEVYFSEEAVKPKSKIKNQPKLINNIKNNDGILESEASTSRMTYNKKPEIKEPNKHDIFESEDTTPRMNYDKKPNKHDIFESQETTPRYGKKPEIVRKPNKDEIFKSEETTPRMNYNKKPEIKEPNKHDIFESQETTPRINYDKKPEILRKPNKDEIFESEETTPRMSYNKKPEIKEPNKYDIFESQETTPRINYDKKPEILRKPNKDEIFESEETTPRINYDKKPEILRKPNKDEIFESEETTPRMSYNKKPEIKELNKHDIFETQKTTPRINYDKKPEILRKPNKDEIFESEETTPRMSYNKKPEIKELNKHDIFETQKTTPRMNYDKKPEILRKPNKDEIFESEETTPRMSYNKKPEIKELNKHIFERLKTTPRMNYVKKLEIKESDKHDIFGNFETTPRMDKKPEIKELNNHDIFESEETTTLFDFNKIPEILKVPTTTTEKNLEQEDKFKPESVKARTENLMFNSNEENATINPNIMKGTGIPTRQRYKMSSPDYYKKLPRIVEKYDFKEPLPEKDREHEKIDDKFAQDPARINKKLHKLNMQKKVSRQFKAILDELGMSLNKSKLH